MTAPKPADSLTPTELAAFDQHWQAVNQGVDNLIEAYRNVTSDGEVSREVDLVLFAAALPETCGAQSMGAMLACAIARLAAEGVGR